MLLPRQLSLLPSHLILSIHQHLSPTMTRLRPVGAMAQQRSASVSSILSSMGVTSRDKRFKLSIDRVIQQARNPLTWSSFPETYNRLLDQYRVLNGSEKSYPFLSQSLTELMSNLTTTRTPNRVVEKYVASIFEDIRSGQWKIPLAPEHYIPLIRSKAQGEDFAGAEACLLECINSFPFSSIPPRAFIAILGEYRRYNDHESLWRVYKALKEGGRVLDRRVYDLVQDAVVSSPKPFLQANILELQNDFDVAELGRVAKLNLLLSTFLALRQDEEAQKAAEKLRMVLNETMKLRVSDIRAWDALIRYTFATQGVEATKTLITEAKVTRFSPSPSLFHRIINEREISTIEQLRDCEEALSCSADTIGWSLVIHKSLSIHGIDAALSIYEESKRRSVLPAAYMLHPLIRALVGGHLRQALEWKNMEKALYLYGDLRASAKDWKSGAGELSTSKHEGDPHGESMEQEALTNDIPGPSASGSTWDTSNARQTWPGPDSMIYDTLLRGISQLARTTSPTTPLPNFNPLSNVHLTITTSTSRPTLWDLALSLLDDMRQLGITSTQMSTTAIIILSMRVAPTFRSAFQVYRAMANGERLRGSEGVASDLEDLVTLGSGEQRSFNQFELTAASYENIIRGFCTLKPKRENGVLVYPPADLYLQIVKDMQLAGYSITEDVYMTFLFRLGRQARALRLWEKEAFPYSVENEEVEGGDDLQELDLSNVDSDTLLSTRHSILHGIRTMHNHIVLNAGITPSIDLLNALLDAYNKVAAVHDAFKVWDTIFLSRIYNGQSVSIILDTCGWAKIGHKAAQIWNQLLVQEFPFNKNNWDSRVECLCRLGKLDEALKVVCLEMPSQHAIGAAKREEERAARGLMVTPEGKLPSKIWIRARIAEEEKEHGLTPDAKTLAVLFSFASQTNQVEEVHSRVKHYLPDVWRSIPEKQKSIWLYGWSSSREEGLAMSLTSA
ncbi:hypothetical protein FRC14_005401 [Serendipita sp. 396]|nr:hypothetical protein FRC14_005401 [Serendipita sp. 396]KAG8786479.1 hypothetical protein FRC15_011370 [Serendipita sp. 397]KAG8832224.1 hypothetical protein FRC18_005365 [Serendipita sp. 400]KAG8868909.1 hypothetical protein FRC20_002521 [Serendipita sp. 405]